MCACLYIYVCVCGVGGGGAGGGSGEVSAEFLCFYGELDIIVKNKNRNTELKQN